MPYIIYGYFNGLLFLCLHSYQISLLLRKTWLMHSFCNTYWVTLPLPSFQRHLILNCLIPVQRCLACSKLLKRWKERLFFFFHGMVGFYLLFWRSYHFCVQQRREMHIKSTFPFLHLDTLWFMACGSPKVGIWLLALVVLDWLGLVAAWANYNSFHKFLI